MDPETRRLLKAPIPGTILRLVAPPLMFGWAGLPPLGVAGAAWALVVASAVGAAVLALPLLTGACGVRLRPARLDPDLFRDILGVGLPASANTVVTNAAIVVLMALVAPFGAPALAGYGLGTRLEYLQIPLVFGYGSALITFVGAHVGAGRLAALVHRGARRVGDRRALEEGARY